MSMWNACATPSGPFLPASDATSRAPALGIGNVHGITELRVHDSRSRNHLGNECQHAAE